MWRRVFQEVLYWDLLNWIRIWSGVRLFLRLSTSTWLKFVSLFYDCAFFTLVHLTIVDLSLPSVLWLWTSCLWDHVSLLPITAGASTQFSNFTKICSFDAPVLHHASVMTFFSSSLLIYLLYISFTKTCPSPKGGCPGPSHRPHPLCTPLGGVRLRWTHVDRGRGQAPCGCPHRK